MSTVRTWHKGPPPHVGWWNASRYGHLANWMWWNGSEWSCSVGECADAKRAGQISALKNPYQDGSIVWTDYWPENARVPRIDPRVVDAETSRSDQFAERLVLASAETTVALAKSMGVVVTISRRPLLPLAMGHAEYVVETRPVRRKAA